MRIFFCADSHFRHDNIRKYCHRPFTTVEEMDETIISNWNKVVGPRDTVYHLGDFAFVKDVKDTERYIQRLRGRIHLIPGNHDKKRVLTARGFVVEPRLHSIKIAGTFIELCHYSFRVWDRSHFGSWSLYGHSHGRLFDDPNLLSFDVGVDCNNFTPISYEEVKERMSRKIFVPLVRRPRGEIDEGDPGS